MDLSQAIDSNLSLMGCPYHNYSYHD